MRSTIVTVGSLAILAALGGCAGRSGAWWEFWKTSSATEAPAEPATAPEPTVATATPAAPQPATATPAEKAAPPAPTSNGFVALPEITDIRFRPGQIGVVKSDLKKLDALVRWLKDKPGSIVMVEGHTDDLGSREANFAVAEKRVAAIVKYLVARGLEPERITTASYGPDRPLCVEKTDTCRAKNRRAHFLVKH
jgi:peptidoglycan-associated lipoprotein